MRRILKRLEKEQPEQPYPLHSLHRRNDGRGFARRYIDGLQTYRSARVSRFAGLCRPSFQTSLHSGTHLKETGSRVRGSIVLVLLSFRHVRFPRGKSGYYDSAKLPCVLVNRSASLRARHRELRLGIRAGMAPHTVRPFSIRLCLKSHTVTRHEYHYPLLLGTGARTTATGGAATRASRAGRTCCARASRG
jgi:hypothetical protein